MDRTDIEKAFQVTYRELAGIPLGVYIVIAVSIIIIIYTYFYLIPRLVKDKCKVVQLKRCSVILLLILYVSCIFLITIFSRQESADYLVNLVPLSSIREFDHINSELVMDFNNMLLFMPFGFLFSWQSRKHKLCSSLAHSFMVSIGIECVQLMFKRGKFDIDDIIFNVLGCFCGWCLFKFILFVFNKDEL